MQLDEITNCFSSISPEEGVSENGSVERYKDSTSEDEERTPKLQPKILSSSDMPSHQTQSSISSTRSGMSTGSSLTALSDSTRSDVSMGSSSSGSARSDVSMASGQAVDMARTSSSSSDESSGSSEVSAVTRASQSISAIMSPSVRHKVTKIIEAKEQYSLDTLIDLAERHLSTLENIPREQRQLQTPESIKEKLDAYKIIRAMWDYTVQRRGPARNDRSIRYTAACIITCEEELEQWIALANTWFGLFLWPFSGNHHFTRGSITEAATPTYHDTEKISISANGENPNRDSLMREAVLKRDDYTCTVKGAQTDAAFHRNPEKKLIPPKSLECAHILKRAVGKFSSSKGSKEISTIDIIRNYCPPLAWSLDVLEDKLDSPSNGITLKSTVHDIFDLFVFCFLPVDGKENTYKIKVITEKYLNAKYQDKEITFRDYSHLHRKKRADVPYTEIVTRSGGPAPPSVELPDPYFLEIHAAVAHVMHASGAAEFIQSYLNKPGTGSGSAKDILGGPELASLRIDLAEILGH